MKRNKKWSRIKNKNKSKNKSKNKNKSKSRNRNMKKSNNNNNSKMTNHLDWQLKITKKRLLIFNKTVQTILVNRPCIQKAMLNFNHQMFRMKEQLVLLLTPVNRRYTIHLVLLRTTWRWINLSRQKRNWELNIYKEKALWWINYYQNNNHPGYKTEELTWKHIKVELMIG